MSDDEIIMIVAKNIKNYMEANNYTNDSLGEELGVTGTTISYWINGKRTPRMSKIDSLCKIFNCKREDLLNDKTSEYTLREIAKDKLLQEAFDSRPEMRALFSVAESASKEDIEQAIKIIEALKK